MIPIIVDVFPLHYYVMNAYSIVDKSRIVQDIDNQHSVDIIN